MNLNKNKKLVAAFYDLNQSRPAEAIQRYVGDMYIQHNPMVRDGKQGFIDYFEPMAKEHPEKHVHFVREFAEGNYVVTHAKNGLEMLIGREWTSSAWMTAARF